MRECWQLPGMVQDNGNNGRVVVAVHNESKAFQAESKISGIEGDALESFFALSWDYFSGYNFQGGQNLHENWRRRAFTIEHGSISGSKLRDEGLGCSNVTAICAERFCQRAHKNVDF